MKENVSMVTAVLAIIISIIAIASGVVIRPASTIGAGTIGENELANNSVTSDKVVDGALTDADISDTGISKIVDNAITGGKIASSSITLEHLTTEVLAEMTGLVDIANNSITGAKIANGTITNTHISSSADIDPSKILGTAWTAANDGSGSGLDADTIDGIEGNQFLRNDASGSLIGDLIVDGTVTVDSVTYSSSRTHYFVVGGEGFIPGDDDIVYQNTYGMGGAFIKTGSSGALSASVHLPHGAEVTAFKVFFYDNSANDVSVTLQRLNLDGGSYSSLAGVSSSGVSEYGSQIDDSISYSTIDNTAYSYHVYGYWGTGDSNVKVRGALITYTIDEAL